MFPVIFVCPKFVNWSMVRPAALNVEFKEFESSRTAKCSRTHINLLYVAVSVGSLSLYGDGIELGFLISKLWLYSLIT